MDRLLRVHFSNIELKSRIFCRIATFCSLQPSVGFASKYRVSRLRNYQQDTSRVSFLRRTRFWTLFFSQTVGKSPKPRFVVATPFCSFQVLVTPDVFRLTPCIKNLRFWRLSNSLTEKQSSETCPTRKTDSRDVLFVVSETPGEIFRDETNRWLEGAKCRYSARFYCDVGEMHS